ncbi:histidine kinase [Plantactinospora mayteni]|uniref:histidine kinase n=1 Tax=Plantactinospora mayteni TaxID=566021 RepID=A0ABQ4F4Q8_9ACTN|nr:sensor histidine kinase [Plantactinospora mayteni]GIH01896.1 two-component sensor histidine kinase [Plantactinospora mayteni]
MRDGSGRGWWRSTWVTWRDWFVAAGVAVLVLLGARTAPPGRLELDPGGYLLLLLGAATLAFRHRAPRLVLGAATAGLLGYQLRGYPGVIPAVPVLFALYAAVRVGHRRSAFVALGVVLVGGFVGEMALGAGDQAPPDVFQRWFLLVGWMVAACTLAEVTRHRQAYLAEVERRATDAERTREETARRRADEERLRIARELHDSLTHSISIIKVQAGVAVHLARKRDEPIPDALLAIQQASGEAIRELRATLEVLRSDDDNRGTGLDRLEYLVGGARRAGMPVTVRVTGEPRTLPAPVDRAAYRIIQEALTNVARHAGPASAAIELDYRAESLTVRVDDDGRGNGESDAVPGVGLVGMRERVAALGGSLHAGPRDGGGFAVRADLPCGAVA